MGQEEVRAGVWGLVLMDPPHYVWPPPARPPHSSRLQGSNHHIQLAGWLKEETGGQQRGPMGDWAPFEQPSQKVHMTLPLLLLCSELSHIPIFPIWKEAWRWIPSSKHSTSTHGSIYEGKRRDWIWGESASCLQHRAGTPSVQRFSLSLKSPRKLTETGFASFC